MDSATHTIYKLISFKIMSLFVTHKTIVAMIQKIENKKVNKVNAVVLRWIFSILPWSYGYSPEYQDCKSDYFYILQN